MAHLAAASYEIDTHNCVIFVKEIAVAAGLAVSNDRRFIHAPGDFLEDVAVRNAAITGRNFATVPTGPQDISTLQNRVQQHQRDSAAARQRTAQ